MSQSIQPNLEAGGTIRPYRFVKINTAADNQCLESDANDTIIGVSAGSTRQFDSANHAEDGDQTTLQMGSILMVEAGASITRGAPLESDADGKATNQTVDTTSRRIGGFALESGSSGEIIRMLWQPYFIRHNLS